MNRVGRLAGALLLASGDEYFLIGNLKRPCDFAAAGFAPPAAPIDALARPYIRLAATAPIAVPGPWLELGAALSGEALAAVLGERFMITRNGSVSDRLWRLILSPDPDADPAPPDTVVAARWLAEIPAHLWNIVRDAVLKCT
jgi:hypothetical protein